jgi:hypothetical protein
VTRAALIARRSGGLQRLDAMTQGRSIVMRGGNARSPHRQRYVMVSAMIGFCLTLSESRSAFARSADPPGVVGREDQVAGMK